MADANVEPSPNDGESNYSTPANDPKNMQEVTQYVSIYAHPTNHLSVD